MPEKKTKKEETKKKKPEEKKEVKKKKAPKEETKTEKKKREPKKEESKPEPTTREKPRFEIPNGWKPKTQLGKKVLAGEITDIDEVFASGVKIAEAPIVDMLLPDLEKDVIFIGGSTGKGGGIRRTPFKRTARMHKSGRRYRMSVMAVVGNRNGYVGIGLASSPPGRHRESIEKATTRAKLNIVPIARGCGSWECLCATHHSIPFTVEGKSGSSIVKLIPAPKGLGLAVSNEIKKIMTFAGISDIWCRSRGNTKMRINFAKAVLNALKKLNVYKIKPEFEKKVGMKVGKEE
ncbi:MAG: 30S ribosomal protein S5 [Candidatus Aenigmatarchaeota archaeon]